MSPFSSISFPLKRVHIKRALNNDNNDNNNDEGRRKKEEEYTRTDGENSASHSQQ